MDSQNIILLALLAMMAFVYIRKALLVRSLPQYSAQEAAGKVKSKSAVLLDVRTGSEWSSRHIPGAIHIPLHELSSRLGELEKHKDKEIICYCQSGNRSLSAAGKLKSSGFLVGNMTGGISTWNFSK